MQAPSMPRNGSIIDRTFSVTPADRQNNVSGQRAGYPVALIHRLFDVIRYQGNVHGHRGAVSLHAAVSLNVFHIHFIPDIRRADVGQHFFDGGPDVLGGGFGNITDFAGGNHQIGGADIDLAVNRQRLAVHLPA